MNRTVSRRIDRLEERAAIVREDRSISIRVVTVDPEKGATRVIVIETGKPNREEPPTPEEAGDVRADLERRRAAGRTGGAV
jgi:hypothetical protein